MSGVADPKGGAHPTTMMTPRMMPFLLHLSFRENIMYYELSDYFFSGVVEARMCGVCVAGALSRSLALVLQ